MRVKQEIEVLSSYNLIYLTSYVANPSLLLQRLVKSVSPFRLHRHTLYTNFTACQDLHFIWLLSTIRPREPAIYSTVLHSGGRFSGVILAYSIVLILKDQHLLSLMSSWLCLKRVAPGTDDSAA
jgi:hypothetical protein